MRLPGRQNVCKFHFPTINNKKAKEKMAERAQQQAAGTTKKKKSSLKNVIEMSPAKQQLSSDTAGISFWSLSLFLFLAQSLSLSLSWSLAVPVTCQKRNEFT